MRSLGHESLPPALSPGQDHIMGLSCMKKGEMLVWCLCSYSERAGACLAYKVFGFTLHVFLSDVKVSSFGDAMSDL